MHLCVCVDISLCVCVPWCVCVPVLAPTPFPPQSELVNYPSFSLPHRLFRFLPSAIAWAFTQMGKCVLDESLPLCAGLYCGAKTADRATRALVEQSDLVVSVGCVVSDVNTGACSRVMSLLLFLCVRMMVWSLPRRAIDLALSFSWCRMIRVLLFSVTQDLFCLVSSSVSGMIILPSLIENCSFSLSVSCLLSCYYLSGFFTARRPDIDLSINTVSLLNAQPHRVVRGHSLANILSSLATGPWPTNHQSSSINQSETTAPAAAHPDAPSALCSNTSCEHKADANVSDNPITFDAFFDAFQHAVEPHSLVVADIGSQFFKVVHARWPDDTRLVSQVRWGAIGHSLPNGLGAALADQSRRPFIFIGDGGLRMTVQELYTLIRCDLGAVVVVFNNGVYATEIAVHPSKDGAVAEYNAIGQPEWRFAELPRAFGFDAEQCECVVVRTVREAEALVERVRENRKRRGGGSGGAAGEGSGEGSGAGASGSATGGVGDAGDRVHASKGGVTGGGKARKMMFVEVRVPADDIPKELRDMLGQKRKD